MVPSGAPRSEFDVQRYSALLQMADVVSRRPHSAQAFLESEELLGAYFSASRVGLCILDADFRYLAINQTLAAINGVSADAHLGKSVREILGDIAELVEPQLKKIFETRQPVLNLEISFMLPTRTEPGHWIVHYIPCLLYTSRCV